MIPTQDSLPGEGVPGEGVPDLEAELLILIQNIKEALLETNATEKALSEARRAFDAAHDKYQDALVKNDVAHAKHDAATAAFHAAIERMP